MSCKQYLSTDFSLINLYIIYSGSGKFNPLISKKMISLLLRIASDIVPSGVVKFRTNTSRHSVSHPRNSAEIFVFSCIWTSTCSPGYKKKINCKIEVKCKNCSSS